MILSSEAHDWKWLLEHLRNEKVNFKIAKLHNIVKKMDIYQDRLKLYDKIVAEGFTILKQSNKAQ